MRHTYSGMTLIEILLVAALMAVLAAIFIPPMNCAKVEAQKQACAANVAALNAEIELYHAQQGNWPTALSNLADLDYMDELPECPFGEAYIYNGSAYRVAQHSH